MSTERLLAILELMASRQKTGNSPGELLCGLVTEMVKVDGAAVALTSDGGSLTAFCTSSAVSRSLLDLEMTVGEGPCTSAATSDIIVAEAHLSSVPTTRWILYSPEAQHIGARAVFGFPIRIGAIRLGALGLHRNDEGDLSEEQFANALLLASVIGRSIVAMQAGATSESLNAEFFKETSFDFSVHQAAGMVAVQGSISISSALVALRMHAFASGDALENVSHLVITRRLRFDGEVHQWIWSCHGLMDT